MSLRKFALAGMFVLGSVFENAHAAVADMEQVRLLVGSLHGRMDSLKARGDAINEGRRLADMSPLLGIDPWVLEQRNALNRAHDMLDLITVEHHLEKMERGVSEQEKFFERSERLKRYQEEHEDRPKKLLVLQLTDKNNRLAALRESKERASFFGTSPLEKPRVSVMKITQMSLPDLALFELDLRKEEEEIHSYPLGEPVLGDLKRIFPRCCFW